MGRFVVTLSDADRAALERYRARRGLRSEAEAVRYMIERWDQLDAIGAVTGTGGGGDGGTPGVKALKGSDSWEINYLGEGGGGGTGKPIVIGYHAPKPGSRLKKGK